MMRPMTPLRAENIIEELALVEIRIERVQALAGRNVPASAIAELQRTLALLADSRSVLMRRLGTT